MSELDASNPTFTSRRANRKRVQPLRLDGSHHVRSISSLQTILNELSILSRDKSEVYQKFVRTACEFTSGIWCAILSRNTQDGMSLVAGHSAVEEQSFGTELSSILPVCERAVVTQRPAIYRQETVTVFAIPILSHEETAPREIVCLVASIGAAAPEPFTMLLQLVGSHISQWQQRQNEQQLHWKLDSVAAVAELLAEVANALDFQDAERIVANRMRDFLGAQTVAIGLCPRPGSKSVRLNTISGTDAADLGGPTGRKLSTLLAETLVRQTITSAPDRSGEDRYLKLAHRQWCAENDSHAVVSAPLITHNGKVIGAWTCIFDRNDVDVDQVTHMAAVVSQFIADGLANAQKVNAGVIQRLAIMIGTHWRARGTHIGVGSIVAVGFLLCIPIPHNIRCVGTLEPAAQRFAAAPHDGMLREAFVKTGDLVTEGQLLARMDGQELFLQMAELEAQRQRAIKEQDVQRTSRDAAATQIAKLEIQRIDVQIQLLKQRQQQLNIVSPLDALVLESDLDEVEGMPVRTGQMLMRLAPIDRMTLQFAVVEKDIRYVQRGSSATISLDGYAMDPIDATIESVRPVSEVRHHQNVFIAEATVDNAGGFLRPGMTGHGKIRNGKRVAGWVYFHHACEKLYSVLR